MSRTRHSWKRIAEVLLTSVVMGLGAWTATPIDTPPSRIAGLVAIAALGPVLVYLRHGKREPRAPELVK